MATIVVIEDETSIMAMLKARLYKAGHRVIEATGLKAAQEKVCQSDQPDLALIDLYLNDTYDEGIEACHWAKKDLNIPVIAMSAFLDQELRQTVGAASDAILRKPEDLKHIIPTIEALTAKEAD